MVLEAHEVWSGWIERCRWLTPEMRGFLQVDIFPHVGRVVGKGREVLCLRLEVIELLLLLAVGLGLANAPWTLEMTDGCAPAPVADEDAPATAEDERDLSFRPACLSLRLRWRASFSICCSM